MSHFILDEYLQSANDWMRACYILLGSPMFEEHGNHIRQRLIEQLKDQTNNARVYLASTVLLYDGRTHHTTFEMMRESKLFPRLVELALSKKSSEDKECRNRLLEVLYEMSRVQRLNYSDLGIAVNHNASMKPNLHQVAAIDDDFISYLFELVEEQADIEDPYHYVVIRALVSLPSTSSETSQVDKLSSSC